MGTKLFKSMLAALVMCLMVGVITNCKKSEYKGNGSVVFYTTTNTYGIISITVSGKKANPTTFNVPVTTNPASFCISGYTGYMLLDVGTYNYDATTANGKKWSGTIDIVKDVCLQKNLQ